MWELGHKESWVLKKWCFLSCGVGEDSWESLYHKEIKSVNPKGKQSWIFIRRTDAESEAPIFWPPEAKSWLIGKDPGAGKDWRQGRQIMRWMVLLTQWTWVWASSGRWWRTGMPGVLQSMGSQSRTQLSDWTTTTARMIQINKHDYAVGLPWWSNA